MLVFCSTTLSLTQKSFSRFYRRKMAKTDRKLLKCLTLMTPKSKFEDSRVWQIVFQTIFKSLHVIFHCHFVQLCFETHLNFSAKILEYFILKTLEKFSFWPKWLGTCTYRVPIWPKKFTSSYFQVRSSEVTFWDIFRAWNSKRQKNLMLSLCFESSSTSHSSQIVARKTTHACPIFHSILPPNFSISPIIFKRESLACFWHSLIFKT